MLRYGLFAILMEVLYIDAQIVLGAASRIMRSQPDFAGLWSFARFISTQPAAGIYSDKLLGHFQNQAMPWLRLHYLFSYPPSFLILIRVLSDMPIAAAYFLWSAIGSALLAASLYLFLPARQRPLGLLAVFASPAFFLNSISGETGCYTAALTLTGFAILPRRPWLSGVAFGLLALKPQLGVLIPFSLLAMGQWRPIISAAGTIITLAVLSLFVFPASMWPAWFHHLQGFQSSELVSENTTTNMVTVTVALLKLGAGVGFATATQYAVLVAGAVLTTLAFKRAPYRLALAILLATSFVATPHAYDYDTIPLIVALFSAAEVLGQRWPLLSIGLALYVMPALAVTPAHRFFLYAIPEMALCAYLFIQAMMTIRHNKIES